MPSVCTASWQAQPAWHTPTCPQQRCAQPGCSNSMREQRAECTLGHALHAVLCHPPNIALSWLAGPQRWLSGAPAAAAAGIAGPAGHSGSGWVTSSSTACRPPAALHFQRGRSAGQGSQAGPDPSTGAAAERDAEWQVGRYFSWWHRMVWDGEALVWGPKWLTVNTCPYIATRAGQLPQNLGAFSPTNAESLTGCCPHVAALTTTARSASCATGLLP